MTEVLLLICLKEKPSKAGDGKYDDLDDDLGDDNNSDNVVDNHHGHGYGQTMTKTSIQVPSLEPPQRQLGFAPTKIRWQSTCFANSSDL